MTFFIYYAFYLFNTFIIHYARERISIAIIGVWLEWSSKPLQHTLEKIILKVYKIIGQMVQPCLAAFFVFDSA